MATKRAYLNGEWIDYEYTPGPTYNRLLDVYEAISFDPGPYYNWVYDVWADLNFTPGSAYDPYWRLWRDPAELTGAWWRPVPTYPQDDLIALWTSRAADYDPVLDAQLDLSGNGHHLRLGSVVGADTNDPGRRLYEGKPYAYFSANANYVRTPHASDISFTNENVSFVVDVHPNNWRAAGIQTLFDKAVRYRLRIDSSGHIRLQAIQGASFPNLIVSTGFAADAGRQQLIIEWKRSEQRLSVFNANTGGLIATNTTTEIGDFATSTNDLWLGNRTDDGGTEPLIGKIYSAEVHVGLISEDTNTLLRRFDAADANPNASTFVSSATGETWTINRSTLGMKAAIITRDMLHFGTDRFMSAGDSPFNFGTGDFTVGIVMRIFGASSDNQTLFAKRSSFTSATPGYSFSINSSGILTPRFSNSTNTLVVPDFNMSSLWGKKILAVLQRGGGQIRAIINDDIKTSVAVASDFSANNSEALRFGRLSGSGTAYAHLEKFGGFAYSKALTEAELTQLMNFYGVTA